MKIKPPKPIILLLFLVVATLGVSTTIIWSLVSANHDLWEVYVAVTRLGGYASSPHVDPAEERVRSFLESDAFGRKISEDLPPSFDPTRLDDPATLSVFAGWIDTYVHRQIQTTEHMMVILTVFTALLMGLLIATRQHVLRRHRFIRDVHQLSHAVADMQDVERERIGRELHDNIGQLLSLARMELVSGQLSAAQQTLDTTLLELRGLSRQLIVPAVAAEELELEIQELGRRLEESSGVSVSAEVTGMDQAAPSVARQAFRIAQELLTNGIRHSGARRIGIRIIPVHPTLVVTYHDDGIGFDIRRVHKGVGLRSIQQRVELFGGTIVQEQNTGTRIRIGLPLDHDEGNS